MPDSAANILYPGTSAADVQRYSPVRDPETGQPRTPSSEVSMNLFLKLMVAQMSNQDPMQPMDDKEFLSQMASISSLQQMTALTNSSTIQQGYSMIGKEIYAKIYDKTEGKMVAVSGVASAVVIQGGVAYLQVGNQYVPVSAVEIVTPPEGSTIADQIGNASNLIGKSVTSAYYDKEDKIHYIMGEVTMIKTNSTGIFAIVRGYEKIGEGDWSQTPKEYAVSLGSIGEISNQPVTPPLPSDPPPSGNEDNEDDTP